MISIAARHNWPVADKALKDVARQIPFSIAVALTNTARGAREEVKAEMGRVFDRPTPFTKRAILYTRADKRNLRATVGFGQAAFSGAGGRGGFAGIAQTGAFDYISTQVHGGIREAKRSERALRAWMAQAGSGPYWVPGPGLKLDRYGNPRGGDVTRILSHLRANPDRTQNVTDSARSRRNRRGIRFFVPDANSSLAPGVWMEQGGAIKPAMLFVSSVRYQPRLMFYDVVQQFSDRHLEDEFWQAFAKAIATAR